MTSDLDALIWGDEGEFTQDEPMGEVVRTESLPAAVAVETVRTNAVEPAPCEPIDKRFEVRLTRSQLARWRAIAAEQGVAVAELVRFAVEQTATLPAGHVKAKLDRAAGERMAALTAAFRAVRHGEAATSQILTEENSVRTHGAAS